MQKIKCYLAHTWAEGQHKFAQDLAKSLRGFDGIKVWLDEEQIVPGQDILLEMKKGIQSECDVVLCIFSPKALESKNFKREFKLAKEGHQPIIPLLLDDCRLPYELKHILYADFRDRSLDFKRLEQLVKGIRLSIRSNDFERSLEIKHLLKLGKTNKKAKSELQRLLKEFEMVYIPAGTFLSGSSRYGESGKIQGPLLDEFCIDIFPVTNSKYKSFIEATGYSPPKHWNRSKFPKELTDHPVTNIRYTDAKKYAKWTGKRLPTKWEWEKAARGVDGWEFPWGDDFNSEKCNTDESRINKTTPVNKYIEGKSPFGCFDMTGNVWEWTLTPPEGEEVEALLHGSSYYNFEYHARCAYNTRKTNQTLDHTIGFRCVISA